MPNVLISSEIGSEGRTISGRRQVIECIGICVLNLAHTPELGSSDVNLHIVKKKKNIRKFSFKFSVRVQGLAFARILIRDFCVWNF